MTLPVFDAGTIQDAATPQLVLDTVRDALIAHAEGRTNVPPPLAMEFPDADGDCHVKAGQMAGAPDFSIKIATSFYRNPSLGLPSDHGLICVVSAETGQIRAILDDRGLLTAVRTGACGALVTHAMARPDAGTLGVFGTGQQARLQALWLSRLRPLSDVLVHGRTLETSRTACDWLIAHHRLPARPATAREAAGADIVVTTTPATRPVLDAAHVREGAHVTGIGTDMSHKNELPAALFGRAGVIATDDHAQCLDHGDFGHAVRSGTTPADSDIPAGLLLKRPAARPDAGITVADLTGVGALDAALASAVLDLILREGEEAGGTPR